MTNYDEVSNRVRTILLEETGYESPADVASVLVAMGEVMTILMSSLLKLSNQDEKVEEWTDGLLSLIKSSAKEMVEDDE